MTKIMVGEPLVEGDNAPARWGLRIDAEERDGAWYVGSPAADDLLREWAEFGGTRRAFKRVAPHVYVVAAWWNTPGVGMAVDLKTWVSDEHRWPLADFPFPLGWNYPLDAPEQPAEVEE